MEAIKPYLEPAGQGPSAEWAKSVARRLNCKVCVGYPEIERYPSGSPSEGDKCYNSLLVVDENGAVITNYRKAFLYYTDETWAAEGDAARGKQTLTVRDSGPGREIPTQFGICMDINPYKFEAPYTAWEFATRVLDSRAQLVILSMAWLTLLSEDELDELGEQPEMDTFNYWIHRFWPLIKRKIKHGGVDAGGEKRVVIVFANRAGEEPPVAVDKPPARYAGTSAVIAVTQGCEGEEETGDGVGEPLDVKIQCWDLMGATSEGICFADTAVDPEMVFKLVKKEEQ